MPAEDVELVRRLAPGPDVDIASTLADQTLTAQWLAALRPSFHDSVHATMRFPGLAPVTYTGGLPGLRDASRDWLRQWASFRIEIEDVLEDRGHVVLVFRGHGRPRRDAPEVTLRRAAVWTVTDGRIASVDFNVPCHEALPSA